jgi:hypothetical protein
MGARAFCVSFRYFTLTDTLEAYPTGGPLPLQNIFWLSSNKVTGPSFTRATSM